MTNHFADAGKPMPKALRLADELCAAPERSRTSFEAAAEPCAVRLKSKNQGLHLCAAPSFDIQSTHQQPTESIHAN